MKHIISLHSHFSKVLLILFIFAISNMPTITYAAKCVDGTCGS